MKRSYMRKRMALVLGAGMLTLSLSACGRTKDEEATSLTPILISSEASSASEEIPSPAEPTEEGKDHGETEILKPGDFTDPSESAVESKESAESGSKESSVPEKSEEAQSSAAESSAVESSGAKESSAEQLPSETVPEPSTPGEEASESKVVIELPIIPIN